MNEWNKIKQALLDWYRREHRQLRWRETKDPYEIWISEIMLQQTRVEAVKGYYDRFLSKNKIKTIGLCYKECMIEKIDNDKYDYKIDEVITD